MNTNTGEIFRLNQKDVSQVVEVLCDAFFDYPVMRYIIDPGVHYEHKLSILINFFVMARIFRDEIILGIGNLSDYQGVALISNPENSMSPKGLNDLREQVWSELGSQSRSRYQRFSDITAQFRVNVPYMHLNMIGIRHRAQGTGFGRHLLEQAHQLSMNDPNSAGVTLTTEDPSKVSFYQHLGYTIIGEAFVTPQLKTWSFFRADQNG